MEALIAAAPMLGLIGAGVAGIAAFGRDRTADQHTVDDYRPSLRPVRRNWPLIDRQVVRAAVPAGPAEVTWRPPYAELVVAQVLRRYGDSPADRAARMLREIAAEQRALAVTQ